MTPSPKTSPGDRTKHRRELIGKSYGELLKLAGRQMSNERATHTLTTTALANEVSVKLLEDQQLPTQNRGQFMAYASKAIRHTLIDYARGKGRQKRGGDRQRVDFDSVGEICDQSCDANRTDGQVVREAVRALAARHPRTAKVVELRYFDGLSINEVAKTLQISLATVKRDWALAKVWLRQELARQ